ncbi:hypothetical protein KC19_VG095000 [Ceratodon purpureus]|uniref:Uncharacterized protein n=1 Tax=Ceratodon purpureus TaxID=3225 RepID=A0A8T0HPB3_CERPU|nr:hypothetical protein KC19_VG095000 [Ceratodon purpureus]
MLLSTRCFCVGTRTLVLICLLSCIWNELCRERGEAVAELVVHCRVSGKRL